VTTHTYKSVSFLSDYGNKDEFVGVVKSVIHSIAQHASIIDITHGIKPHDIRAGSLALARASQYLLPGVVLAVVDPGVGSDRRAVAIEVNNGEYVFVGPDNGLLALAIAMIGDVTTVVELDRPDFHIPTYSSTFHGRDIFAPVTAHLCAGTPIKELGTPVPELSLQPGLMPISSFEGNFLLAEVLWEDHFGNLQLNISEDDLKDFGENLVIHIGDKVRTVRRVTTFNQIQDSEIGIISDSSGLLALCAFGRSAGEEIRISEGQQLKIENGSPPQETPTMITIKEKP
jgi:S-adenosylmethionine hydrolase